MCCLCLLQPHSSCVLQVFSAVGLRHPAAGAGLHSGTFVPNTVHLGGDSAPFIVLTGPNMGGKSTLMRQVGLGHRHTDRRFGCCQGLRHNERACVSSSGRCCMMPLSTAIHLPRSCLHASAAAVATRCEQCRQGLAHHRLELLLAACQAAAQVWGHDSQTGSPRRQSLGAGVPGGRDGPGGGLGAGGEPDAEPCGCSICADGSQGEFWARGAILASAASPSGHCRPDEHCAGSCLRCIVALGCCAICGQGARAVCSNEPQAPAMCSMAQL